MSFPILTRVVEEAKTVFRWRSALAALIAGGAAQTSVCVAKENLLRNGSFEQVPGAATGQGLTPVGWLNIDGPSPGAHTTSTDGSYGVAPGDWRHFLGITAFHGIRWVAAGHGYAGCSGGACRPELFGQVLSATLEPGVDYQLSAQLLQSQRADVDHPGGYHVLLAGGFDLATTRLLGSLDPTTDSDDWETRELLSTAPPDADSLPLFLLRPYRARDTEYTYPGIDAVCLSVVLPVTDEDGVPNDWKLPHFSSLTNVAAQTDWDGDGF